MKLLLDTHTAIWMAFDPTRLSSLAKELLVDLENERFFSAASVWELAIKMSLGKLNLGMPLDTFVAGMLKRSQIVELPVAARHAVGVAGLPLHHRDPFDRVLVAQAKIESLTLVSADPEIAKYDVQVIW